MNWDLIIDQLLFFEGGGGGVGGGMVDKYT